MRESDNIISFEQLGLGSVLKQNQLIVPPNQREYSWEEREVTTLLKDYAKAISEGDLGYFLGTIVTIPRGRTLEVIDGQQRLATTAILLAEIRNYMRGIDEMIVEAIENEFLTGIDRERSVRIPKLTLNVDDNEFFRAQISDDSQVEPSRQSHRRIAKAAKYCANQIKRTVSSYDKKDHRDVLNGWISFIENNALVVMLRVPNDANAYKMFETLNDRGLKTSQSDLVKNYLFSKSGSRLSEIQQKWAYMKGTLESLDDDDITVNYLRHALIAMQGYIRESQVYDAVQAQAKTEHTALAFVSTLELVAVTYTAIQNPEHEKWNTYPLSARRAIEIINLFNIRPMRALMLAIAHKLSPQETSKSFGLLISAGVRLMITGSTRSGSVEIPLAGAANKIFTGEMQSADDLRSALVNTIPNDTEFEAAFSSAAVSKAKLARYYLRTIEQSWKKDAEPALVPNADPAAVNLEHVLPTKPESNWPNFDDDQVRMYSRKLGNLCLLRTSDNADLKSSEWSAKKEVYAKSSYALTRQISEAEQWGVSEIADRQAVLATLAVGAWPF